jgi:hypothetical protein
MDFIEGLPKSDGYSVILVVVDRLTKFAHFLPVKHPYSAITIAKLFMDNVVKLHGLPQSIVTDRDTVFVSAFWKELFKLYKVQLNFSTAYHPQTDGQTERVNQCVEMYLRCAVQDSPKQWKAWLSLAELWYNSAFHSSLGCSPFKALYGHDPQLGAAPLLPPDASPSVTQIIEDRELHLQMLKQRLQQAQNRMNCMLTETALTKSLQWAIKCSFVYNLTLSRQWQIAPFPSWHISSLAHTQYWRKLVLWPID